MDKRNPPEFRLPCEDEVGKDADDVGGGEEVQASVDGVAVLGEVVWVEILKGLVALSLVSPLGIVVVCDFLVQLLDCHCWFLKMGGVNEWRVESRE